MIIWTHEAKLQNEHYKNMIFWTLDENFSKIFLQITNLYFFLLYRNLIPIIGYIDFN